METELFESMNPKQASPDRNFTPNRGSMLNMLNDDSECLNQRNLMQMYLQDSYFTPNIFAQSLAEHLSEDNFEREKIYDSEDQSQIMLKKLSREQKGNQKNVEKKPRRKKTIDRVAKKEHSFHNYFNVFDQGSQFSQQKETLLLDQEMTQFELITHYYNTVELLVMEKSNIPLFTIPIGFDEVEGEIEYLMPKMKEKNSRKGFQLYKKAAKDLKTKNKTHKMDDHKREKSAEQAQRLLCGQYEEPQVKREPDSDENQLEITDNCKTVECVEFIISGFLGEEVQITQKTKELMIMLRNSLQKTKLFIEQKAKQTKKEKSYAGHICRICGEIFGNGRQLGGHMSRKHPGTSQGYTIKKEIYKMKKVQRKRRMYFKNNKKIKKEEEYSDS